ncbi:MAG: FemAB family XrtA/PEP-CTERM system-associated protein [Smithella sp.]
MYVKLLDNSLYADWAQYVINHPKSTLYHLLGWKSVIEETYGHKPYYLVATRGHSSEINGVLPLFHFKHVLFGNHLISMPFFDMGGILADNEEAEKALLFKALELCKRLGAHNIELRHQSPFSWLNTSTSDASQRSFGYGCKSQKVRMLLPLPEQPDVLMASFKSKLRSQIKKTTKDGLTAKVGGIELLDDFFSVFSVNMRDLGSPVHSKYLMANTLSAFPNRAAIIIVNLGTKPVACSLVIGFKEVLYNPWASSLRKYAKLSPNMLLYWTMLAHACAKGYASFDYGRSTPLEGTYNFKAQWGAKPNPLHWEYMYPDKFLIDNDQAERSKFSMAISCWRRLPVCVAQFLGPMLRRHIGL